MAKLPVAYPYILSAALSNSTHVSRSLDWLVETAPRPIRVQATGERKEPELAWKRRINTAMKRLPKKKVYFCELPSIEEVEQVRYKLTIGHIPAANRGKMSWPRIISECAKWKAILYRPES